MTMLKPAVFVLLTLLQTASSLSQEGKTLLEAVSNDDLMSVRQLLAAQADISPRIRLAVNADPSLILIPVRRGRADILETLVAAGFRVDVIDPVSGNTALFYASDRGYLDIVRVLLTADPRVVRPDDLNTAVRRGFADVVAALLDARAPVNALDHKGSTALLVAITAGKSDLVKLLLDHRADPNQPDDSGLTPLMAAVRNGDLTMVRMLLEAGANPGVDMFQLSSTNSESSIPSNSSLPSIPPGLTAPSGPDQPSPLIIAEAENKTEIQRMLRNALLKSGNSVGMPKELQISVGQQLRLAARASDPQTMQKLRLAIDKWETVYTGFGSSNVGGYWNPAPAVTPEWILAFNDIDEALDHALQQNDPAVRSRLLGEIADDVITKADYCLSSFGALGPPVEFPVVTFRAGVRVEKVQLCWKPRILEFLQGDTCYHPFRNWSSLTDPATAPIIPGKVLISGRDTTSNKTTWNTIPAEVSSPPPGTELKPFQFALE
jgi:ankyrin repeat protein